MDILPSDSRSASYMPRTRCKQHSMTGFLGFRLGRFVCANRKIETGAACAKHNRVVHMAAEGPASEEAGYSVVKFTGKRKLPAGQAA